MSETVLDEEKIREIIREEIDKKMKSLSIILSQRLGAEKLEDAIGHFAPKSYRPENPWG